MRTTPKKMGRMPDIRKRVLERLKSIEMSRYELVEKLGDKVPKRTVYHWLGENGKGKGIGAEALGYILDVLGGDVTFPK